MMAGLPEIQESILGGDRRNEYGQDSRSGMGRVNTDCPKDGFDKGGNQEFFRERRK